MFSFHFALFLAAHSSLFLSPFAEWIFPFNGNSLAIGKAGQTRGPEVWWWWWTTDTYTHIPVKGSAWCPCWEGKSVVLSFERNLKWIGVHFVDIANRKSVLVSRVGRPMSSSVYSNKMLTNKQTPASAQSERITCGFGALGYAMSNKVLRMTAHRQYDSRIHSGPSSTGVQHSSSKMSTQKVSIDFPFLCFPLGFNQNLQPLFCKFVDLVDFMLKSANETIPTL